MLGRELTGANGYRWSRQYGVKNMGDDTYELVHASTNKHACALDDIAVDSGVAASADQLVPACAEICPSPSSKRPPPF